MAKLNSIKNFEKGHILISEGQYYKTSFYVLSGLVRQFKIIDGKEVTSNFYTEDQSIIPSNYASKDTPSPFTLICEEDSQISVVSYEMERELCTRFPRFEKMCRVTTEQELMTFHEKFSTFIASSPEERYLTLMRERPSLFNRVALYHISSYLGMKPESLSRIRKRISEKK